MLYDFTFSVHVYDFLLVVVVVIISSSSYSSWILLTLFAVDVVLSFCCFLRFALFFSDVQVHHTQSIQSTILLQNVKYFNLCIKDIANYVFVYHRKWTVATGQYSQCRRHISHTWKLWINTHFENYYLLSPWFSN